jgi:hypothetical protein
MIPINFILNFQVNASKAAGGIKTMSNSMEKLAKSENAYRENFSNFWKTSMPEAFAKSTKAMKVIRDDLSKTFASEMLKDFNGDLSGVSKEFKAMYKDNAMFKIEDTFSNLTDQMIKR